MFNHKWKPLHYAKSENLRYSWVYNPENSKEGNVTYIVNMFKKVWVQKKKHPQISNFLRQIKNIFPHSLTILINNSYFTNVNLFQLTFAIWVKRVVIDAIRITKMIKKNDSALKKVTTRTTRFYFQLHDLMDMTQTPHLCSHYCLPGVHFRFQPFRE